MPPERRGTSLECEPYWSSTKNLKGQTHIFNEGKLEGAKPLQNLSFPSCRELYIPILERGIKQVPRKIKDFSGCLKGVRLI